ncbi:MAG: hypothetical protein RJA07_1176 [Bacteroidota bacterium]|jgi:hypothetical protein
MDTEKEKTTILFKSITLKNKEITVFTKKKNIAPWLVSTFLLTFKLNIITPEGADKSKLSFLLL